MVKVRMGGFEFHGTGVQINAILERYAPFQLLQIAEEDLEDRLADWIEWASAHPCVVKSGYPGKFSVLPLESSDDEEVPKGEKVEIKQEVQYDPEMETESEESDSEVDEAGFEADKSDSEEETVKEESETQQAVIKLESEDDYA